MSFSVVFLKKRNVICKTRGNRCPAVQTSFRTGIRHSPTVRLHWEMVGLFGGFLTRFPCPFSRQCAAPSPPCPRQRCGQDGVPSLVAQRPAPFSFQKAQSSTKSRSRSSQHVTVCLSLFVRWPPVPHSLYFPQK